MSGDIDLARTVPEDRPPGARTERLDESFVGELASYPGAPVVTSVYLDVDGRSRPIWADCLSALEALFRVAKRMAGEMGPDQTLAVEEDLKAIGDWVHDGVDRSYVRGLAIFSCASQGFLCGFPLPS